MGMDINCVVDKVCRETPELDRTRAEEFVKAVFDNLDERLIPNVQEWIEGRELSDIWIGKYCIGAIMSIHGDSDFLSALEAMNVYLHDEEKGTFLIWRGRR